jgi:hypothetical protein
MRHCPVCDSEMAPRFASECEPPVAWACLECGVLQLESGGRPFSPEEAEAVAALAPAVSTRRRRPAPAAAQAREILETFGAEVPVDVESLAGRLGFAVRWRSLPPGVRATVGGEEGHRVLVLNRDYPFRTDAERRWAVAEELGHAVLGHGTLVASPKPGGPPVLAEPVRRAREREARAFAAELLMPAARVRQAFAREQSVVLRALGSRQREEAVRTVVARLAREFRVSPHAMRLRLADLGLLP